MTVAGSGMLPETNPYRKQRDERVGSDNFMPNGYTSDSSEPTSYAISPSANTSRGGSTTSLEVSTGEDLDSASPQWDYSPSGSSVETPDSHGAGAADGTVHSAIAG